MRNPGRETCTPCFPLDLGVFGKSEGPLELSTRPGIDERKVGHIDTWMAIYGESTDDPCKLVCTCVEASASGELIGELGSGDADHLLSAPGMCTGGLYQEQKNECRR